MSALGGLLDAVTADPGVARVVEAGRAGTVETLDVVAAGALRPFVVAALAAQRPSGAGRPVLAVTATTREAEDLAAALRCLVPAAEVAEFPAWETLPHERLSPRSDTVGRRLAVLRRLAHPVPGDPEAGPVRRGRRALPRAAAADRAPGSATSSRCGLAPGDDVAMDGLVRRLVEIGYTRTDLVDKPRRARGARRHPRRVPTGRRAPAAAGVLRRHRRGGPLLQGRRPAQPRGGAAGPVGAAVPRAAADPRGPRAGAVRWRSSAYPALADLLGQLAEGMPVEGMESLAPVLADGMDLLLDVLPAGAARRAACDPERVRARAADLVATSRGVPRGLVGGGRVGRGSGRGSGRRCGGERRSTWARRPTAPSARSARTRPRRGGRGSRCRRSGATRSSRTARTPRATSVRRRHRRGGSGRALPRRYRPHDSTTCARGWREGWRVVAGHRGPRAGAAAGRAAPRRPTSAPGWSPRSTRAGAGLLHVTTGLVEDGFVWRRRAARGADRVRPGRAADRRRQDMRRLPSRRARRRRPAAAACRATTWCTSSTASAGTSR